MTRDLRLVALALFAWGIGEGMFFYFQAIYLEQWGADPVVVGAALGGLGVAMAVSQAPAGYLADRFGPRPLMWASWIFGTLAAWGMALAGSLALFIFFMVAYGLTSAVLAPMNSYITSVRGQWTAGRALATTSASFHLGAVLGPVAGGTLGELYGLANVYKLAAGLFVISTLFVLFVRRHPVEPVAHGTSTGLLQNRSFIILLGLMLLTTLALYFAQPLTPLFLQDQRGLSLQQIGLAATFGSLGIVTLSLSLGRLRPAWGFLAGQPLVALFVIILMRTGDFSWVAAAYFLAGGYRLSRTMALALGRTLIQPSQTGLAFGLLETMNGASAVLAPAVSGWLYARSPESIYTAALALIGTALAVNLILLPVLQRHAHRLPQPAGAALEAE